MTQQEAQELIERYIAGDCTPEEAARVEAWWNRLQSGSAWEMREDERLSIHDRVLKGIRAELADEGLPQRTADAAGDQQGVPAATGGILRFLRQPWRRYADVAAAVVIVVAASWYALSGRHSSGDQPAQPSLIAANDIPPGGNHAILTLGNGKQILLDSAANGLLATGGNGQVTKHNNGLEYAGTDAAKPKNGGGNAERTEWNSLSTPRGGQYQLVLADGTRVWLDAASTITYPSAFTGRTRQVTVTGQAYFEVAKNPQQPFEVKAQGQTIRDIGTAFNINAYTDEPASQVTLASGAIAVGVQGREVVLQKPGLKVEYRDGRLSDPVETDLVSTLAWKNGLFNLASADIATVMRQIARWYDADITFEKGIPSGHITGQVPRNTSLSTVLKVLQTSGVHCRVEGKKIIVTP